MNLYTHGEIDFLIGGCEIDGPDKFRNLIGETFKLLPEELISFCQDNIHFFSLNKKIRACTFNKEYLEKKWAIFVDSTELERTKRYALKTLLHEIGHAYSGHIRPKKDEEWDQGRSDKEEEEADEFAERYLPG